MKLPLRLSTLPEAVVVQSLCDEGSSMRLSLVVAKPPRPWDGNWHEEYLYQNPAPILRKTSTSWIKV